MRIVLHALVHITRRRTNDNCFTYRFIPISWKTSINVINNFTIIATCSSFIVILFRNKSKSSLICIRIITTKCNRNAISNKFARYQINIF